jgi:hypothetical protein
MVSKVRFCGVTQVAKHAESASDQDVRVAIAVALQRQQGGGFDRLTKTRTAARLLQVCATACRLAPDL